MTKATPVAILLMLVSMSALFAQSPRTRVEAMDPAKHHQDLTLRVTPDQPATFTLPASNSPIRMDMSVAGLGPLSGMPPNPILRSATLLHNSLTEAVFLTDGNNPPVELNEHGVSFTNQPGADGVRMTVALSLPPTGTSRLLQISSPVRMDGFTMMEVRIALWY